jgi:hypothetical protein
MHPDDGETGQKEDARCEVEAVSAAVGSVFDLLWQPVQTLS